MNRWRGKVAVVTGASAGMGVCIVKSLLKHDIIVVGVARRVAKVEDVKKELGAAGKNLYPLKMDVSEPNEVKEGFKWIKKNLQKVHIVVNNAGVFMPGTISEGPFESWKKVYDVNVLGLCSVTSETLKLMKETGVNDGHIVNINSVTGHSVPNVTLGGATDVNINVYPGSKFAVTAISEVLRQELRVNKIKAKVTCVCPGVVATDIYKANGNDPNGQMLRTYPSLGPQDIADAVIYALATPPHVLVQDLLVKHVDESF